MSSTIEIRPPIKKVIKWIKDLASKDELRKILTRATLEVADRARAYPPEGPWNFAPGVGKYGWYQRHFGPRRLRKDGSTWGKNTSQKLQKSWKTDIQREDIYSARVYTKVTYAPFLMDAKRRAHWAKSHGWQTTQEIADDYTDRFEEIILEAIDEHFNNAPK